MIADPIKKHFWKLVIFCFVGGTSAVIHMATFNISRFGIKLSFFISLIIAVLLSVCYNFYMNRNITFSAGGHSIKKQLPRYALVYSIAVIVNILTALIIKSILEPGTLNENIATISGIIFSIPVSFLGSLLWAFKNN